MELYGRPFSIVNEIADEIEFHVPAPIRDHEGFESNDSYVSSREATALAGTAMHVEGHPDTGLTLADLVCDCIGECNECVALGFLDSDLHDFLA